MIVPAVVNAYKQLLTQLYSCLTLMRKIKGDEVVVYIVMVSNSYSGLFVFLIRG